MSFFPNKFRNWTTSNAFDLQCFFYGLGLFYPSLFFIRSLSFPGALAQTKKPEKDKLTKHPPLETHAAQKHWILHNVYYADIRPRIPVNSRQIQICVLPLFFPNPRKNPGAVDPVFLASPRPRFSRLRSSKRSIPRLPGFAPLFSRRLALPSRVKWWAARSFRLPGFAPPSLLSPSRREKLDIVK